MGQINSVEDGSTPANKVLIESKDSDADNDTKALQEKVRCVKTRIDMLIEDCLTSKDSTENETEKTNECAEGQSNDLNEEVKTNEDTTEEVDTKSEESDTKKDVNNTVTDKSEVSAVNCGSEKDSSNVKEPEHDKESGKLDLADIIKDSVNTELTLSQLKQIRQRTITTFNTFIDKVLDNSLNKEFTQTEPSTNNSNILKLCSESMIQPAEEPPEKKAPASPPKTKPEEPVKNDNIKEKESTEKTITLKEHIERFLEISFREEILEDNHTTPETKVTLPENFNAQGLVNSMIHQGIQINQLIKGKPNSPTGKGGNYPKEDSKQRGRILKVNETRTSAMNSQGQRSPNMRSYGDNNDRRVGHDIPGNKMADPRVREHPDARMREHQDARMREHYFNAAKADSGHRMVNHPGFRVEDVMDRNREVQAKMGFDGVGIGAGARPPNHMATMYRSPHLQVENSPYLPHGFGPRIQLSPGGRELKYPIGRDGKMHPRDCGCPYCVQMSQQCKSQDFPIPDHHNGKHSPLVSQALYDHSMALHASMSGHLREVPVSMMKPLTEMSPIMAGYHGMPKMMPQSHPVSMSKVYGPALHPEELPPHAVMSGRRPGLPEPGSYCYPQRPGSGEDVQSVDAGIRSGKRSPFLVRPSSVPSQEHNSRPNSGYKTNDSEYLRNSDPQSGVSECSGETPLDLTVKKPKSDSMRNRSSSDGSNMRKINPSLTFIRHLESSVDRHWQELSSSPPPSQVPPQITINNANAQIHNNRNHSNMYPRRSPNESPPSGMVAMLSNRQLRSPHYMGGITVGQPLVDIKPQVTQKQPENMFNNAQQSGPPTSSSKTHSQQMYPGNQSNVDTNSKRNQGNNVSKHEPIQNIIGNNDPNDILYLICRLCTQTYGSPYGFRKHFRNQHGFEPRAEHTIVQTISATKTALHVPQAQPVQGMVNFLESQKGRKSMTPEDGGSEGSKTSRSSSTCNRDSPASVGDTRSIAGSEEGDKCDADNSETKFLQCPECGKTFQLNDFGSYKRHCRQHGSVKLTGPFTCSDCHLPFPDQKVLREHYILHVNDGAHGIKQEKIGGEYINMKNERPLTKGYNCNKCEVQFDNFDLFTNHMNSHTFDSQGSQRDGLANIKTEQKRALSIESGKSSPANTVSSSCITIQAAESMTSLACPDSSWDNVAKVVATSDRAEPVSGERRNSGNSSSTDVPDQITDATNMNSSGNGSPSVNCSRQKSIESGSDTSEDRSQGSEQFVYKHKKFFHHRKRANSNLSVEASEPKQTKFSSDASNSSVDDVSSNTNIGLTNTTVSTCESVNTTSIKPAESESGKSQILATEKSKKTEARHSSLPFVWDRTIQSQRKS